MKILKNLALKLLGITNEGGILVVSGTLSGMIIKDGGTKVIYIKPIEKLITNTGLRDIVASLIGASSTRASGENAINDTTYYKLANAWNIGTGTNPEAYTDTGLQTPIFTSPQLATNLIFLVNTQNNIAEIVSQRTFNFTQAYTITEVGLFSNIGSISAGSRLLDRVLLNPPIQVQNGDILSLTYTIRFIRP